MPNFKDKIILVTGACDGIGAEAAHQFAAAGCAGLALVGHNQDSLDGTIKKCVERGMQCEQILVVLADLSKEEDVKRIMAETIQRFNQLDVLVNSAEISGVASLADEGLLQVYDRVIKVNVRAMLQLTQLAVPHLIQTKGNIVNSSSVFASRTFPSTLPYNISKAAVCQFTRCIALDLAPKEIRVNAVGPGAIQDCLDETGSNMDDTIAAALAVNVLGRSGAPSEVAKAILYLASDDASFITGTLLPVDGGRHIMCPR